MNSPKDLLAAAKALSPRPSLDAHFETVKTLREKGLTWREIADWLGEHGIETDHAKVFRMFCRLDGERSFVVPSADQYADALESLHRKRRINASALAMLRHHYAAHNRTVTYTQLAEAAAAAGGKHGAEASPATYRTANNLYGKLGRMIGEAIDSNFRFVPATDRGAPFYSSSIGAPNPWKPEGAHFELVMHHELAEALRTLKWFTQGEGI